MVRQSGKHAVIDTDRKFMKTLIVTLYLILSVQMSTGNPFLMAIPLEHTDYYVISIDGTEYSTDTDFDMTFLYDLKDLPDGRHNITITPGSYDNGMGGSTLFYLIKRTTKQWIHYTIKKDNKQLKTDPWYNDRFDEPLSIKIRASASETTSNTKLKIPHPKKFK